MSARPSAATEGAEFKGKASIIRWTSGDFPAHRRAAPAIICHLIATAVLGMALAFSAHAQITVRGSASVSAPSINNIQPSGTGGAVSATSGNVTPALPANWHVNDVFLALVESRDNVAASMPSGWTLLSQASGASGLHQASIFWKRAAAGDTAPTVTHPGGGRIVARIYGYRGVDLVVPFDVANSFTGSAADFDTEAASITTTNMSRIVFASLRGARSTNLSKIGNWSQGEWHWDSGASDGVAGDGVSLAVWSKMVAAGVQPLRTLTQTDSAESHGAQIALRGGNIPPLAKPAGTVAGDVMVATLAAEGASSLTVTAPSGWTLVRRLEDYISSATGVKSILEVYVRAAGASEPSAYTWSISPQAEAVTISIVSFTGVDAANPIDVEAGQRTVKSQTHATPDVTTTVANAMLVTAFAADNSSWAWSPPAGMTEAVDIADTLYDLPGRTGVSMEVNYAIQPVGGPTGVKIATNALVEGTTGHTHILALRPATPSTQAQLYFIQTDHLNTPRVITNQAQQVVWRMDNTDPFGGNVPDENPSGLGTFTCNLRFPGQYFDKETNLHYNYFRDYDPARGQYEQSDPVGLAGGLNTYSYGRNNSLILTDPYGLFCVPEQWAKVIAATGGGAVTGVSLTRTWQGAVIGGLVGGVLEFGGQQIGISESSGGIIGIGMVAGVLNTSGDIRARAVGAISGLVGGTFQATTPGDFSNTVGGLMGGLLGTFGGEIALPPKPYSWPGLPLVHAVRGGFAGIAGGFTQDVLKKSIMLAFPCMPETECK